MPQPPSGCAFAVDPNREMTGMIYGFCVSQIIRTAAELSLADHLAAGPCTAEEVAQLAGSAGHHLSADACLRRVRVADRG
jgi:hypothetical protein